MLPHDFGRQHRPDARCRKVPCEHSASIWPHEGVNRQPWCIAIDPQPATTAVSAVRWSGADRVSVRSSFEGHWFGVSVVTVPWNIESPIARSDVGGVHVGGELGKRQGVRVARLIGVECNVDPGKLGAQFDHVRLEPGMSTCVPALGP